MDSSEDESTGNMDRSLNTSHNDKDYDEDSSTENETTCKKPKAKRGRTKHKEWKEDFEEVRNSSDIIVES